MKPTVKIILSAILILLSSLTISAQITIEKKTFNVKNNGNLKLKTDAGGIRINTSSNEKAEVYIYLTENADKDDYEEFLEDYELEFHNDGADLEIVCKKKKRKSWINNFLNSRDFHLVFEINVPKIYNVDVSTNGGGISVSNIKGFVETRTSGGGLHFTNIKGDIDGRTSGGGIDITKCISNVNIRTSGGGININECRGDIDASTSGGGIKVKKVYGKLNASTSGGSIYAEIMEQPKNDCSLTTSGGGIKVKLQKGIKADLDASTSAGYVECDLPITIKGKIRKSRVKGKINGGGPQLRLRSSAGNVRLLEL